MFQIAGDLTMLQVAAPADSAAIQRIRPGQNASIEIMGISTLLSGQVREVQPEQVIIEFTSPSQLVRPGMTARVTIKLS
jgi:multidrug resistance efflux pump